MKQRITTFLLASVATAGTSLAAGPQGDDPLSNEGILELMPGADPGIVASRYGFVVRDAVESRGIYLVSLESRMTHDAFESLFVVDTDIDHTELNFASGDPGSGTQSIFLLTPPDQFEQQPVRTTLGLAEAQTQASGSGVIIAVIDSGVDPTHPTLAGSISPDAISFLTDPGLSDPADFFDTCNGVDDDGDGLFDETVGHGTAVASLALMVAPNSTILPIRVVNDEGHTTAFRVAKAIYYAIDHDAKVINLSLSTRADVRIIERAVDEATAKGIIVVAAAGNNSSDVPEYPAAMNKVAGVVSVNDAGVLAEYSNRGPDYFIAAPGTGLTGAIPNLPCGVSLPAGSYGQASGTSLATPLVAGTAALLIEKGTVLRWTDFRFILRNAATDISGVNPGNETNIGAGMLDIAAAMAEAGPCHADLNDDGVLDFADIQAFIIGFIDRTEVSDLADTRGLHDMSDIQAFIEYFLGGCP